MRTGNSGAGWRVVAGQDHIGASGALDDLSSWQASGGHEAGGHTMLHGETAAVVGDQHGLLLGGTAAGIGAGNLTCTVQQLLQ